MPRWKWPSPRGFNGGVKLGAQRLQESGEAFLLPEKVPVANIGEAIISASYQFDLWGTFKRGTEAAKANADAVQAAADTARITLVADVVKAYTQVCSANEEYHIARESLGLQEQSVQLNQRLRDAGRGDETQVTRSQTQFKSLRAELPRFKAEREAGLYTLAALLAKPVEQLPAGTADCAELPHITQLLPVGDGAALLKRRPDVRQAERQLAAATAAIGVATGALYPDISIGAQVGTIGILENLGDPSTNRWGFGPQVSWTIPTNGTRARIRMAEASTQAALAHFDGVVLTAIRETQTRLAQYSALLERRDALADAERSAKESADQTHLRYRVGRESFWPICRRPALIPMCARSWLLPIPRWPWGRSGCSWPWAVDGRARRPSLEDPYASVMIKGNALGAAQVSSVCHKIFHEIRPRALSEREWK